MNVTNEALEQSKVKHPGLIIFGIMMFYVVMADFTLLTPAVETVYRHFEATTSYTTVLMSVSITGIVSFPSSILFGMLYDKIGYKLLGLLGILIVAIGGSFPFFAVDATDYTIILASRIIVGLGLGAVNPIGAALITRFFEGKMRVRLLGIGNTVFYGAATVFAVISGALASNGWNYVFLGYGVAIIPFFIVLFCLKEPPKTLNTEVVVEKDGTEETEKARIPLIALGYCLIFIVYAIGNFAVVQLMSTMIAEYEIGSPLIAGFATSAFTLGGVIAGLIFSKVFHVLDKWMMPVLFLFAAISALGLFFTHTLFTIILLSMVDGCVNILLLSFIQGRLGAVVPPSRVATANGMLMGLMNLGTFLGAYYIEAIGICFPGLGLLGTRLVTGIILLIAAVGTLISAARAPRLKERSYAGVDPGTE